MTPPMATSISATADDLAVLTGSPPAATLLPGYDRHHPSPASLREQLDALAASRPWARLSWAELIDALLAVGRADVPLARLFEGHVDAIRILDQAGREPAPDARYGVWASRSQQTGVRARRIAAGRLLLDGTIKFASGAGVIDHALVPVWLDADTHLLLDLPVGALPVDTSQWVTAAMEVSRSHTVTIDGLEVPDDPVGDPNFYLDRRGFFPGGIGVAACWAGGALRIADLARARLHEPIPPAMLRRLGQIDTRLVAAQATLRVAGDRLDTWWAGDASGPGPTGWRRLATEGRAVVAEAAEQIIGQAERLAGPAGLAFDLDLTRAVHDLRLYVLQRNADADDVAIGAMITARSSDGC